MKTRKKIGWIWLWGVWKFPSGNYTPGFTASWKAHSSTKMISFTTPTFLGRDWSNAGKELGGIFHMDLPLNCVMCNVEYQFHFSNWQTNIFWIFDKFLFFYFYILLLFVIYYFPTTCSMHIYIKSAQRLNWLLYIFLF